MLLPFFTPELSCVCPSCVCPSCVCIGCFDGVHRGHRALFSSCQQTGLYPLIIYFRQHSSFILRGTGPLLLTSAEEKHSLIAQCGVEPLGFDFSPEIAQLCAKDFLHELKKAINICRLVLGHDAKFGKDRLGDFDTIAKIGESAGFAVEQVRALEIDGQIVSSSWIRSLIASGDLDTAQKLLGRPYSVCGIVQKGLGKGSFLGFPTANLCLIGRAIPPYGVYSVTASIDDRSYKAVANLGLAPTIHSRTEPQLEVHLLDYTNRPLYGSAIACTFDSFIRCEKKFHSIDALKKQIESDINYVKRQPHRLLA